ncbi:MAG: hypothetical protein VX855_08365 [Verrucomicrobiota bacterium]|nr:hypothetical protein [Verrucomicrobiota bacterium]MEC8655014.1 hypothetical protein [Verrucomicrobiota bacterium]MEE3061770.1 hypothetical protein [Verrucomicrobiota bacterium]
MKQQSREGALRTLASAIDSISLPHPVRVGIDGMSASGKTRLADDLAETLRTMKRSVFRAGLDGFHNPPEIRHRLGPLSVKGYFEDSFDYNSVREQVLLPLGPKGDGRFREGNFDYRKEQRERASLIQTEPDSILLFEGVMLFNEELVNCFDYRILVECSEEKIMKRAKKRDLAHFKSLHVLEEKYLQRFLPGQRIHSAKNKPEERADAILGNDDLNAPDLRFLCRRS